MTMTNAEWMIKNGMSFENLHIRRSDNHYYEIGYYVNDYDRICNESGSAIFDHGDTNAKNVDVVLHWLQSEHHEPILDDAEKRYLSAVIKPFRKYVISIRLQDVGVTSNQRVTVFYNDYVFGRSSFALPTFKKGTMYKGMEVGRKYTPEELGL